MLGTFVTEKSWPFLLSYTTAGQGTLASSLRASGNLGGAARGCPSAGKRFLGSLLRALAGAPAGLGLLRVTLVNSGGTC